ncbi:diaminopimelate decarboxylase [Ferruginivarius sediminum]|uniref:Diaminopimelate decarboxylase n=1 Tax=Ferruginivarius sediminum TaxID=2661937 RepID=A0A369THD9_9PROT|nr:diaminopimelate decarboxylase [Ferruginivarius sediminum]RDD62326.1 diaminopimelate decarboxylase [Ferruginivarius sediminum]
MWIPSPDLVGSIVEKYGTPTFVYDGQFAERNFNRLRHGISKDVDIFYSLKANPNISVTNEICRLGAGAEVSSLAELCTAVRAGVDPRNIIFVGPAKSEEEIDACIEHRIFAIVCESIDEMAKIDAMARDMVGQGFRMPVMIRVNPEFSGAGSGLAMSGKPRQFGIDERRIRAEASTIRQLQSIEVLGFHIYMGTRYLEQSPILKNTANILSLTDSLADELGISLKAVDIGGGLGVPYFDNEEPLDVAGLSEGINEIVREFRAKHRDTRVIMELGRFLVAGCGVMLTKVRYVKESMGETFAIADGGTNLHMAAVGIGSFVKRNFPVINFSSVSNDNATYTVTGPLCTPNDTLAKRVQLKRVGEDDILGVLLSGAYGPTASPTHFLSHGYPAEVLVIGEDAHLVRRRETVEDMLNNQILVRSQF